MSQRIGRSRLAMVTAVLATAIAFASMASAQERPADLEALPPVPTDYTPEKTAWGDYDFSHTWQYEYLNAGRILFQRPPQYGNRIWVTDEEFARRLAAAEKSDSSYSAEGQGLSVSGTEGLSAWMKSSAFGKRTSLIVDPPDGQLPPLTPEGKRLFEAGRSGWVVGQHYDWVSDFDTWDRCITRGFPASMFPNRYNNGVRIFQSPGYIVIQMEMLATRIIPIGNAPAMPAGVEQWMGHSRAHWEGKTLVVETTNIKSGDSVSHDPFKRSASPVIVTMIGGAPFNTTPVSRKARTTERLTMTGPNTIMHELTYSDPETYAAPWTTRMEWVRDDKYEFYEYACHEGNHAIRGYITSSRAERAAIARGERRPETAQADSRSRFTQVFDRDPGVAPPPAAPASPPAASPPARGGDR